VPGPIVVQYEPSTNTWTITPKQVNVQRPPPSSIIMMERAPVPSSTWTFVSVNKLQPPEFTWRLVNSATSIEITDTPNEKKDHAYTVTIQLTDGTQKTSSKNAGGQVKSQTEDRPPATDTPPMIINE
jgi:hypothetical protein